MSNITHQFGVFRIDHRTKVVWTIIFTTVVVSIISLSIGAISINLTDFYQIALSLFDLNQEAILSKKSIVLSVRLPRLLLGLVSGASLGMSGALLQGLFRNSLADPNLLGVSSGAALGASFVMVLLPLLGIVNMFFVPLGAFIGAMTATLLVLMLAKKDYTMTTMHLLLAGVAINALTSALTGVATMLANDVQLRSLTFWLLGSLNGATWDALMIAAIPCCIALVYAPFFAKALNALSLGEQEAYCLGIDIKNTQRFIVVMTCLSVGSAVAFTGMIGFVGLVGPHLVRMMIGPDHRYLIPCSALTGALVLGTADMIARTFLTPIEIPIGIVTSLLGVPFFIVLLRKKQGS